MLRRVALPLLSLFTLIPGTAIAQPSEEPELPPAVSRTLPANIVGAFLIDTTDAWGAFNRFNPLPFDITGPGVLPFLPAVGNYSRDVQPWVGRWASVVLMPPPDPDPATEESIAFEDYLLMVVPVEDTDGMNAYIQQVRDSREDSAIEQQYQGVTILEWEAQEPPSCEEAPDDPTCIPAAPESPPEESPAPEPQLEESPEEPPAPGEDEADAKPQWSHRVSSWLVGFGTHLSKMGDRPSSQIASNRWLKANRDTAPTPESDPEMPEMEQPPFPVWRPGLSVALMPGYMAVASTPAPLKDLIDASQETSKLADLAEFQRLLDHPEFGRSLVALYANVSQVAKFVPAIEFPEPPPGPTPIPPPNVEDLKASFEFVAQEYTSINGLGWVSDNGFRTQSRAYYRNPKPELAEALNIESFSTLGSIPAATYLSVSSYNFKRQWERTLEAYERQPTMTEMLDSMRQALRDNADLDLEDDIISWMDGEYSAFLFPTKGGFIPSFNPQAQIGIGITIQTSDRATAERTLAKVDDWIESVSSGFVEVVGDEVKGQSLTSWRGAGPDGRVQSLLARSWLDDNTLAISTGSSALADLIPQPFVSLNDSYTFQTATASFSVPNHGYFYLNMGSLLSLIYGFLPPELSQSPQASLAQQALSTVRSLSLSTLSTAEMEQSDFFLVLSPARSRVED